MKSVTVRVLAADLAREMVVMRRWLDRNRYEPMRFDCNQNGGRSFCRLTSRQMRLPKHLRKALIVKAPTSICIWTTPVAKPGF